MGRGCRSGALALSPTEGGARGPSGAGGTSGHRLAEQVLGPLDDVKDEPKDAEGAWSTSRRVCVDCYPR